MSSPCPVDLTCKPQVTAFFDAPTNTVSYVVKDPASASCAVVDSVMDIDYAAGRIAYKSADAIIAFIEKNGLKLEWLIETHVHADHLSGAPYIQGKLGGKIGIGENITIVQNTFGKVFNEGTEFFDPIQGAVANCYYIAALASVAWAKPFQLAQMTRATGSSQQNFVDMVRFYKPDSGGALDKQIEVTEAVPQTMGGNYIYARSSETSEIWPSVYEKAYAKLKTGISGDHPDITATAWGDCVWATAQLTGGRRFYYDTASRSDDTLWNLVRGNSMSYRTFNPMTAWTYSTGAAAERHLNYSGATVVASHCYSVLGWAYYNNRKYIVLRNPWGNTEATVATFGGTHWMYDISWWRPITMNIVDGTFAMEAWAFKHYFAGLGVAK